MNKIYKDDCVSRFIWNNKHIPVPPEFINDTPAASTKITKEDLHG